MLREFRAIGLLLASYREPMSWESCDRGADSAN